MSAVMKNSLQARLHELHKENRRGGLSPTNEASCRIIEVYDRDYFLSDGVPDFLVERLSRTPHQVFARVKVEGEELVCPFLETADQLFGTHGNAANLKGRRAILVYNGLSRKRGRLVLRGAGDKIPTSLFKASNCFDIGDAL